MILLAVDTSGPVAGVAVVQDGLVRYEAMVRNKLTHSENMMPMVEEALNRCGLSAEQLDLLGVTVGPGSFTGVRLGVTAVKALAHALGIPAVAVDALDATAQNGAFFDGAVCPIQDARAGQVYGAAYLRGEKVIGDAPVKLTDFCAQASALSEKCLFLGDGAYAYRAQITEALGERAVLAPEGLCYLRPAAVALRAWQDRDRAVDYLSLQPMYLRAQQAERQKNLRELGHE